MAVVALKSGPITNRDASPKVLNNPIVGGGFAKIAAGVVETGSADSIASTYRMLSLPSNARVSSLRVFCDAIATAPAGDIGLYKTTADGGAVVDVDFFATAQLFSSALQGTEVKHEANANNGDIANLEKPIWSALGLTSDPGIMYDVVITLTVATTAAGTIGLECVYV